MLTRDEAIQQFTTACLKATGKPYDRLPHRQLYSAYCEWQKQLPKDRPALDTIALRLLFEKHINAAPDKLQYNGSACNVWVGWTLTDDD